MGQMGEVFFGGCHQSSLPGLDSTCMMAGWGKSMVGRYCDGDREKKREKMSYRWSISAFVDYYYT